MLKYLLVVLALSSKGFCMAQVPHEALVFGYDKAGNQVQRQWEDLTQAPNLNHILAEQTPNSSKEGLEVYPNATNGRFNIRVDSRRAKQIIRIRILLLSGYALHSYSTNCLMNGIQRDGFIEIPIDLSHDPLFRAAHSGIVVLELTTGEVLSKKIIIR